MTIKLLEKEFFDFFALISPGEFERNPEIENEVAAIRRMIAEAKRRFRIREQKIENRAARRALVLLR